MRTRPLTACVLAASMLSATFAGCGPTESPGPDETISDSSSTRAEHTPVEERTRALARRLIADTDSAFQAVEPLSAVEKRQLRRYLQPQHIVRARRLGLDPVRNRRTAADLGNPRSEGREVARLHTNDFYIVDPSMSYAVPLVIPSTKHLLQRLGRRFQTTLLEHGLPPYRFVLTNVLRTGQDQAALQGTNVNAAQGQSTHEYGTTVDIFYEWFHYAAVHDTLAASGLSSADSARAASQGPSSTRDQIDEALLKEQLYEAYVRFGKQYAVQLKALLGRTILRLQEEGKVLATYERRQPVFHLTVAERIAPPAHPFSLAPSDTAHPAAATSSSPAD